MINALHRIVVLMILLSSAPVVLSAYSDPGSGILLWQLFLSGLVGALFQFRRVRAWFRERILGRRER